MIERASEYSTNAFKILSLTKKEGKWSKVEARPCLDLRRLNAHILDLEYPFPKMQHVLDSIGTVSGPDRLYTTLDIRSRYLRFTTPEEDRNWIALRRIGVHYAMFAAQFGINMISAKLQQLMDKIFSEVPFVGVYIDEIVVFPATVEDTSSMCGP